MIRLLHRSIGICAAIVLSLLHNQIFASQPPILVDFDDGLPSAFVGFPDGQVEVNIELMTTQRAAIEDRPGQSNQNQVLKVTFDVQEFGGIVQPYFDTSKNWAGFAGVGFWFYGEASGNQFQFEIYENRIDLAADPKTGERFEVRFDDTTKGWRKLTFSFDEFQRSTDFQEIGAPDDGFTLDAVSGYSIVLPIMESGIVFIDDIQLMPNDPLANFEEGLASSMFIFPGNNPTNQVTQAVNTIDESDSLAIPGQAGQNRLLEVAYSIEEFGGFTHAFDSAPRDWSDFTGVSFWFYGEGSNNRYQFELFDNRSEPNSDTAERFESWIDDNFLGWRFFQIPFEEFVRAKDYQPEGAPDDGLGLNEVWGYSVTLPLGEGTLRLDNVALYNFIQMPSSLLLKDYEDGPSVDLFTFNGEFSSVVTGLLTVESISPLSMPNQTEPDRVFGITYKNTNFAGFSQFVGITPDNWTGYTGIQFWFYGTGANVNYEFELLTNRSDQSFDTSERFETDFFDAEPGWKLIELPFVDFERSSFQPEGAPNDGFSLGEVWGYAITLPQGEATFYMDDVELIRTVDIADYDSVALGSIFSFSGISSTITNTIVSVDNNDLFALLGAKEKTNLLEIQYDIADFGGVTTSFEPFPQDWSSFTGLSFQMFGTNSQRRIQLEIQDKRANQATESSEIFEYILRDDFIGWRQIQISFISFARARDFQFDGALNDGFTTSEIWGYSITLPAGQGVVYFDNFALTRRAAGLPPVLYMPLVTQ